MTAMLTINHLGHSYGSHAVLRDISATIEKGSFYAVMGNNGCGKTTLLRLCAGLLSPTSGAVLVDGLPVADYAARQLARRLALVGQQAYADFGFTAYEIVMMARNPYQRRLQNESQRDRAVVEEAMRRTNTLHLRDARPSEMSGGELRRVMLARALAQETPLLLLDEPLANLDISHQFEIMELLRHINRTEHKTILMAIHSIELALRYCPRLLLLHQGGLLYAGDTAGGLTPETIGQVFGVEAKMLDGDVVLTPMRP